jgi:hypothetical protein
MDYQPTQAYSNLGNFILYDFYLYQFTICIENITYMAM